MPFLIIHGHFYQPPRENPWTGIVEEEPSAAPFHDWNERIHFECYRPNAFVRIGKSETTDHFLNNYSLVSFNVGPTLLSWLEQHHAYTYARIIEADRESALKRSGHGNAIAQAYGHAILPLCNAHDLRTQIRWGVADFRYRFAREPEALWLPETACNDQVLAALIDEGLRFVILAPHQAASYRTASGSERVNDSTWTANENNIDTSLAYRYLHRDNSRRSIAVFFYDGPTSRAIAFEGLLKSSRELADRFVSAAGQRQLLNIATDGETYGHHFKFGDICLSHVLEDEAPSRGFKITNYGEYLDEHPPCFEVEIAKGPTNLSLSKSESEGTSWSCPHGISRWMRDCGCHTGGEPGWNQRWRTPLRQALDFLRDVNIDHFQSTSGDMFLDPWKARDESIALILDQRRSREQFLYDHSDHWLSEDAQLRALTYLELQRMLLLMYASCGWFFSDISGIETIQILRYAGRAIHLMEQLHLPSVRTRFLEILAEAKSNRLEMGTGADIYQQFVEPLKSSPVQEPIPG